MRALAVIPARGGSKGLPGKNLLPVLGRPLIAWSIAQARAVPAISTVVVSTDSEDIAAVARDHGAEAPFLRPAHLANDAAATEPVMLHALDWYTERGAEFDVIILLQPTSPLRLPGTLAAALSAFLASDADSLLGVCRNHHFFWKDAAAPEALYDYRNRPRRQDIPEPARWYRENGSIYITRVAAFRQHANRLCGKIMMHVMKDEEGIEIDDRNDLVMVSALMEEITLR